MKTQQNEKLSRRHRNTASDKIQHQPAGKTQPSLPLKQFYIYLIVFLVAVVCFIGSRDADFVFDDAEAVTGNKDVTLAVPWTDLFHHDFWGSKMASNTSHKSYRPLTVLTLRWNYWLAGGLHPRGFHVVNILLHGLVCILLLPVFDVLLEVKGQEPSKTSALCALMFAVHAVHTESVVAVVGRADLLCAVTFLLSFLAYHRSLQCPDSSKGRCSWLGISMVLCVISTLCKEIGITVLGVCLVYDIIVYSKIDPLTFIGVKGRLGPPPGRVGPKTLGHINTQAVDFPGLPVWRMAVTVGTASLILIGRWQVMGSSTPTFQLVDNPHSFVENPILRFLNYNYLYSINAYLLLNPWWLCFDWSMGCVPVIESLLDPRLLAVCVFWFVSGMLIGQCLFRKPGLEQRRLTMALSVLVLPFLPASNLFFRVGFVIAERVLYLPSVGFVMLAVIGLEKLYKIARLKKICQCFVVLLLVSHGVRSHLRTLEWQTEKTLFESGESVCPLNAKVQYNIAKANTDSGDLNFVIEKYRLAIRLNPQYDQAMNNLGNIFKDIGQLEEAEELLLKARQIRPSFAAAWMNLGIVQASLNQTENAEKSYHTALLHRRNYADCYYNMGNLYLGDNRHSMALAAWRNATLQKPNHISAWSNIIILLDNLGRISDLGVVAKEAISHNPEEPSIYYNVANALGKAGKYEEAEPFFLKALELQPDVATFCSNLAVLYHRWDRLDKAKEYYQKALLLEPNNAQIQQNYQMLLKKLRKVS